MRNIPQTWRMKLIAQRLLQGAVIAYPTEGVWGLGCLPDNHEAVARILTLKHRGWEQGLVLVAANIEQFEPFLQVITPTQRATLETAWPGFVTFVVPDGGVAPAWIRGKHEGVALRVSAHPVIAGICNQLGGPIVSTSANPTGKPPAKSTLRLRQYFAEGIDLVVPGELGNAPGVSEIRLLETGEVLRPSGRQTA